MLHKSLHRHVFFTITILLLLARGQSHAQDMQFTQFYAAPLYLNPALAGATPCWRVGANYRNQWFLGKRPYPAYMASADKHMRDYKLGLGGYVLYDPAGAGNYTTYEFAVPASYNLVLSETSNLRFGIQPAYQLKYFIQRDFTFGDQFTNRDGLVQPSADVVEVPGALHFFDLSTGTVYFNENFFIGLALHHILRNRFLKPRANNPVGMKTTLHGGYRFPLANYDDTYLTLAANVRNQANFYQTDLGFYLDRTHIFFGVWYRGMPFLSRGPSLNQDMLAFLIGWRYYDFRIGYSYDLPLSVQISTFGSHELSVVFEFCTSSRRKPPRYIQQLPCPNF